jgi:beta-lactamase regulating signal transducer with metallopeptidase domain
MLRAGGGAASGAASDAGDAATRATLAREGAFVEQETALPSPLSTGEAGKEAEWSPTENLREWVDDRFASLVPWLVVGWLAGVAVLLLRFAGGFVGVRRLKQSALPVADELQRVLARLAHRLRVTRAVRLCESALVEVPTVVGHLKPVILLPACALTGLKPAQLAAVLAHELAHIRRHDYLFNLLQTTTETLLFYHPAAWWLSRRVRAEREHASDDLAVSATGDVLGYARALAALEQLRRADGPAAAPALALAANGGSLMKRIQRLVNLGPAHTRRAARAPFAAAAALLLTLCGVIACAHALTTTTPPAAVAEDGFTTAADAAAPAATVPPGAKREVAFTFVNFPGNNVYSNVRLTNKTRKLMRLLKRHRISAVGFVNEGRLYKNDGEVDEERVALLGEWLDAGHELGNETFRHTSLYDAGFAVWRADVELGEKIMSELLAKRGAKLRYFSYPYLNTGENAQQKAVAEKYLRARGYQIHPVTIDNMDWLFNRAYIEALRREDEGAAARIRAEFVTYMERMFEFTESYSREVVGREFPQVLMLTGGALNADCLDDLVAMMKRRGYSFVTMEQAMKDDAYSLPDTYTGERGDSWIARWAVTKGLEYRDTEEVNLPEYMQQYFAEFRTQQAKKNGKK